MEKTKKGTQLHFNAVHESFVCAEKCVCAFERATIFRNYSNRFITMSMSSANEWLFLTRITTKMLNTNTATPSLLKCQWSMNSITFFVIRINWIYYFNIFAGHLENECALVWMSRCVYVQTHLFAPIRAQNIFEQYFFVFNFQLSARGSSFHLFSFLSSVFVSQYSILSYSCRWFKSIESMTKPSIYLWSVFFVCVFVEKSYF